MTPEQEERLGQMMWQDAWQSKQIKRPRHEKNLSDADIQDKIDAYNAVLIMQYLKRTNDRVHRLQIIKELDVGSRTIDRCLRKLAETGKVRRIRDKYSTYWEAVNWPKKPIPKHFIYEPNR
jgi:hypothetical protein